MGVWVWMWVCWCVGVLVWGRCPRDPTTEHGLWGSPAHTLRLSVGRASGAAAPLLGPMAGTRWVNWFGLLLEGLAVVVPNEL